eukprot:7818555-Pyramimonas_sp.AAC.1
MGEPATVWICWDNYVKREGKFFQLDDSNDAPYKRPADSVNIKDTLDNGIYKLIIGDTATRMVRAA